VDKAAGLPYPLGPSHVIRAAAAGLLFALEQGTLSLIMPNDFLGPTLEEVQVWLRSAPDSARAGFVLSVEVVNARLGRVLIVEDDPGIATQLVRGLTRAGYETGSVTTGQAALDWPVPDVVLLDLGLPDIDGIEVCRRLRQACDAAIIVVTARGEESDRVLALDEGADDYLIKPFGLQELLARIRAVLRRSRQPAGQVLQHGALTVDLRTHKVSVSGQQIAVTPKEFAILECLASDPGRVVGRQEMLERAWDEHWYGPTKVLDVHMAALRRKLGDPGLIETVYGHGFRLADPDGHQ